LYIKLIIILFIVKLESSEVSPKVISLKELVKAMSLPFGGNIKRIIEVLEPRIERWKEAGKFTVIYPKDASFEEMYVVRTRMGWSANPKWEFTAIATVFKEDEMTEKRKDLYRKIASMDIRVEVRGLIKRKPHFSLWDNRSRLIPSIRPNKTLIEFLKSNPDICKAMGEGPTEEIVIGLYSGQSLYEAPDFYLNPSKIAWSTTATKGPTGSDVMLGNIAKKTFDLLDLLSYHLREFTKEIDKT